MEPSAFCLRAALELRPVSWQRTCANKIDVLLLGPHFAAEVPETKKLMAPYGVKVMAIDPDNYAALDGEAILEDAIDLYDGVLDD